MLTMDDLREWGADVEEGLRRCFDREDFYLRLVGLQLEDPNFERLEEAILAGNARAAFEAAHAIKGATGNLALTPIYAPVVAIAEKLRGQSAMQEVSAEYAEMNAALARLRRLAE